MLLLSSSAALAQDEATNAAGALATSASSVTFAVPQPERVECEEIGFFAVEPTANLELNLTRWARASLGGGYRVTVSENKSPLASDALSGFVLRTSVAFGRF